MGGIGSGRSGGRLRADSFRQIDIRRLHRKGALKQHVSLHWYWGTQQSGAVDIYPGINQIRVCYRIRQPGDIDFSRAEEKIPITRTPCNFGGSRPWFMCPGCESRVAILYFGGMRFLCRFCHNIVHDSAYEGKYEKFLRKSRKLRSKLGADVLALGAPVTKPKGMQWQTFFRLNRELVFIEDKLKAQLAYLLKSLTNSAYP